MLHNPGRGFCDYTGGNPVGNSFTSAYIEQHSPKLVLCGHIHGGGPSARNPNNKQGVNVHTSSITGKRTVVVNPGNLGRFDLMTYPNLETVKEFEHGTFVILEVEEDGTPTKVEQYSVMPDKQQGMVKAPRKLREFNLRE